MKRKKRKQTQDNKGWASYRIRGIKTSLINLERNQELSTHIRRHLLNALDEIIEAVAILDEEKKLMDDINTLKGA